MPKLLIIHNLTRKCPPSLLQPVKVVLVAFGFKLGAPDYIDFIFDVRSVPNPWKLNDFKVMRAGVCYGF